MKVYVKGLNTCTTRRQSVAQYVEYMRRNGHELVATPEEAEKTLVWTCAFRRDVRDRSLAEIAKLKERGCNVVVGGCLPDIDPETLAAHHDGDILRWKDDVVGLPELFGGETVSLNDLREAYGEDFVCEDIESYKNEHPEANVQFYDSFNKLVISEGCPLKCSYCSERLMFPPFKSFAIEDLVEEVEERAKRTGIYKFALLADSLGDYGRDVGLTFIDLLRRLREVDSRIQFVLFNLNPYHILEYFDEFDELMEEGYFFHINMPMQSASNKVLELMKRPYTVEGLERIFALFDKYGFDNFDTHIIVGFPGEEEEDFLMTKEFILKHKPNHVLLSGCMLNSNIPADSLPDKVDREVIIDRIQQGEMAFKDIGLFCNSDGGALMKDRFASRMK